MGGVQTRHSHPFTQISFLISGELFEQHPRSEWTPTGSAFGRKPAGLLHENRWGNEGVLIFSVEIYGGELEATEAQGEPGWSTMEPQPALPELVRACLLSSAASREEAMWDPRLCATVNLHPPAFPLSGSPGRGRPSGTILSTQTLVRWRTSRVSIAPISQPTFRNYYGIPPSVFRRNVLVARAINETVCARNSLTRVAYDVGFSDQSHMSRLVRGVVGINPLSLRKFLAGSYIRSSFPTAALLMLCSCKLESAR